MAEKLPTERNRATEVDLALPASTKPPARRGRTTSFSRPKTDPDLFSAADSTEMPANDLIWEGCNILAQGPDVWAQAGLDATTAGAISFWLTNDLHQGNPSVLEQEAALALIEQFDIRAACLHLIYAAHATQLERPWEQQFVISDRQLERYLGLDKSKKLNRPEKLRLLLELAKQPCHLLVYVAYPEKGDATSIARTWLWEIAEPILHFQKNLIGESELVGFTLKVRAGNWAQYFLSPANTRASIEHYDDGVLSQEILHSLMSSWHKHEGAARLVLWLLFKTKEGSSAVNSGTLLRVAFGAKKVEAARQSAAARKRLVSQWKTALKVLDDQGWQFVFDALTYPPQYRPDRASNIDTTADKPAHSERWPETDRPQANATSRAYGGFEQLLEAEILICPPQKLLERLAEIQQKSLPESAAIHQPVATLAIPQTPASRMDGALLKELRTKQGLTQSALSTLVGKSLSWVKQVETGRRAITAGDQVRIQEILNLVTGQD